MKFIRKALIRNPGPLLRRPPPRGAPPLPPAVAGPWDAAARSGGAASTSAARDRVRVVLITGFESFNVDLYKQAAVELARQCPAVSLRVFSDRDIGAWDWEPTRSW